MPAACRRCRRSHLDGVVADRMALTTRGGGAHHAQWMAAEGADAIGSRVAAARVVAALTAALPAGVDTARELCHDVEELR